MSKKLALHRNTQAPNFREGGKLYLIRCFACDSSERGRENYLPAVASGQCAWCGWEESHSQNREAKIG